MKYPVKKSPVEDGTGKKRRSTDPKASAARTLSTVASVSSALSILAVPVAYMIDTLTWNGNMASWPYYVQSGMAASVVLGLVGIMVALWIVSSSRSSECWSWVVPLTVVAFVWDLLSTAGLLLVAYALGGWF